MTLTQPSRRGFLAGLLAAPAIVQYGHLMPVKLPPLELLPFEPWSDEGLLPISWITREFARQVHNRLQAKGIRSETMTDQYYKIGNGLQQQHVDFEYSTIERHMTSEQFRDRVLAPAATLAANQIWPRGRTVVTADLELPANTMEAARERMGGVTARGVSDYFIGTDSIITRLDILHS